jgi:hypothetical protein
MLYSSPHHVANLVCFAKALAEYPEIRRVLTFSHFVKTNKLAEVNFPWVAKKVLGKNNISRSVVNLYFQVLNDGAYDSNAIRDHDVAIKKAKSHSRYAIGSSKVFSRGYDDKYSPKHHAAIHWDEKNIVTTAQEIWRVTRKDVDETTNKPVCGDPNAYYILPMIYNDLDQTPTWSEERLRTLQGILQFNKNIFDEFQSLVQTPGSKRKRKTQEKGSRFWIPDDFDVEAFGELVTFVASTSKGDNYGNLAVEAHTWLLEKYMELEDTSNHYTKDINLAWLEVERFQPLFDAYKLYKNNPRTFRERFWAGAYPYSDETDSIIQSNLVEYKLHQQQLKKKKEVVIKKLCKAADKLYATTIDSDANYQRGFTDSLAEQFNMPKHQVQQYTKEVRLKWINNHDYLREQKLKVYDLIFEVGAKATGQDEWIKSVEENWYKTGVKGCIWNVRMFNAFRNDQWNILTDEQKEKFDNLVKEVKTRAYKARPYDYDPWNKGLSVDDPRVAATGMKISKTNIGNPNLKKKFLTNEE